MVVRVSKAGGVDVVFAAGIYKAKIVEGGLSRVAYLPCCAVDDEASAVLPEMGISSGSADLESAEGVEKEGPAEISTS